MPQNVFFPTAACVAVTYFATVVFRFLGNSVSVGADLLEMKTLVALISLEVMVPVLPQPLR